MKNVDLKGFIPTSLGPLISEGRPVLLHGGFASGIRRMARALERHTHAEVRELDHLRLESFDALLDDLAASGGGRAPMVFLSSRSPTELQRWGHAEGEVSAQAWSVLLGQVENLMLSPTRDQVSSFVTAHLRQLELADLDRVQLETAVHQACGLHVSLSADAIGLLFRVSEENREGLLRLLAPRPTEDQGASKGPLLEWLVDGLLASSASADLSLGYARLVRSPAALRAYYARGEDTAWPPEADARQALEYSGLVKPRLSSRSLVVNGLAADEWTKICVVADSDSAPSEPASGPRAEVREDPPGVDLRGDTLVFHKSDGSRTEVVLRDQQLKMMQRLFERAGPHAYGDLKKACDVDSEAALRNILSRLRKKLKSEQIPDVVKNVRGKGYALAFQRP